MVHATARATSSRAEVMTHAPETRPSAPVDAPVLEARVESPAQTRTERAYAFLARVGYWSPVIAALVLFAQVSFLGLRPALAEAQRLSDAEVVQSARHARALATNQAIRVQLAARNDPVFRERQRRLRTIAPARANGE